MQYNAISNEGLHVLCPVLESFTNLTAVDLSNNPIVLSTPSGGPHHTVDILAGAFSAMPRLSRLNLGGVRLSRCLCHVLERISGPLSALRLANCDLHPSDVDWLSRSPLTSRLEEMDLGSNDLSACAMSIVALVVHVAGTLMTVDMTDTGLNGAVVLTLFITFAHCAELRYVNLNDNAVGAVSVIESIELLPEVPRLRAVRLTVPSDVIVPPVAVPALANLSNDPVALHDEQSYDSRLYTARTDFAKRVQDLLSRLCVINQRSKIRFLFKI